jgi:protein-disulfide isomerase
VLRQLAADPSRSVEYSFLHFPFDQACNAGVPMTRHPGACAAARLVDGAGAIGGEDAFWKAHAWFAEDTARSQRLLDQGTATGALAEHLGLDAAALLEASLAPNTLSAIQDDITLARSIGLTKLPWIVINGKVVPQWQFGTENLLASLVDAARGR